MPSRSILLVAPRTPEWEAHKQGLALQPDVAIAGDLDNAQDALTSVPSVNPSAVIVATRLSTGPTEALVARLLQLRPRPRVVAVADVADRGEALRFLRLGVSGFLLRDEVDATTLLDCLDRASSPSAVQVSRTALLAAPEPETERLSLLLAVRDPLAQAGLRALLADDPRFQIVSDAASDPSRAAERLRPDLILVDPQSRGGIDCAMVSQLWHAAPQARLVVLSAAFEPEPFLTTMLAHVHAWLVKGPETSTDLIQETLALVGRFGVVIVDASIAERFWSYPGTPIALTLPHQPKVSLSSREDEVLILVAKGESNHAIAARLNVSERTAEAVVTHLIERLGASNRANLVYLAVCEGILPIPPRDTAP
jgi:DNA-binding NarL/FixJ family response regulator